MTRRGGNNEIRMANQECCRGVCVKRLNNESARRCELHNSGVTLIEMIVVVAVIVILAGLVLSTVGYVQKKAARSRAETEIAALSAACESYKADNGIYPRDTANNTTDNLAALTASPTPDPSPTSYDPNDPRYSAASSYLYSKLSGNPSGDRSTYTQRSYLQFKLNMLSPPGGTGTVTAIRDPFGNSYGYSTAQQADPSKGFNPTFDLWSTAGTNNSTNAAYEKAWVKNW